jgi:hypothetical protein
MWKYSKTKQEERRRRRRIRRRRERKLKHSTHYSDSFDLTVLSTVSGFVSFLAHSPYF